MLFITKRASNLIAVPTKRFCLNSTIFVIPIFSIVTKNRVYYGNTRSMFSNKKPIKPD